MKSDISISEFVDSKIKRFVAVICECGRHHGIVSRRRLYEGPVDFECLPKPGNSSVQFCYRSWSVALTVDQVEKEESALSSIRNACSAIEESLKDVMTWEKYNAENSKS